MAISTNTTLAGVPLLILVGAPDATVGGSGMEGAAYVFTESAALSWIPARTLADPGALDHDYFGTSVSISGETMVVGAPGAKIAGLSKGAAYVFTYLPAGPLGLEPAWLLPSNGVTGDKFGESVSISGNTVVVGAPAANGGLGAAYVFVEPSAYWMSISQNAEFTASDGVAGDDFGWSVSISDEVVAVGAPYATVSGNADEGAGYVFGGPGVVPGLTWANESEPAALNATDGVAGETFGKSVSISEATSPNSQVISGITIVVGAPHDTVHGSALQGAAFVFPYTAGAGGPGGSELTSPDGVAGDAFGTSVAVSGNTLVVGAQYAAGGLFIPPGTFPEGTAYSYATGAALAVGTTQPTGTYGAGTAIPITVMFSDDVTVTGTPELALNDGAVATYTSGSGTGTLTFTYTVVLGQATPDLDYASAAALSLNGGTITDVLSGLPATLTLPAPGGALDELAAANIVVSTPPPTVTGLAVGNATGTYGTGDEIYLTVDFSDAVNVTGTPELALNDGGVATYLSGSGTDSLDFRYNVGVGQATADLDYASTAALSLNGGTILDATSGLAATLTLPTPGPGDGVAAGHIVINTLPPTVTGLTVGNATRTYGAGDEIDIYVDFSDAVNVTGMPELALNDGGVATYTGGSGTDELVFYYAIMVGQATADLDYASTTALSPNGGTILDAKSGLAATLTLPTPGERLTGWRRQTSSSTRRRRRR